MQRDAQMLRSDGVEVPVEKTYQAAPPARDGSRWIIAVARDVSARLRHEDELRQSQDTLRQAEQVMALVEDRDRIARDLHDTVIQRLFGVGLGLQTTLATVDDRTRLRLDASIDEIDTTIRELRTTIFALQGSRIAPDGLRGQLLTVTSDAGRASGLEPRLEFQDPSTRSTAASASTSSPPPRSPLERCAPRPCPLGPSGRVGDR